MYIVNYTVEQIIVILIIVEVKLGQIEKIDLCDIEIT